MADKYKGSKVTELKQKDFDVSFKLKKPSGKPGLVVFYHHWCGFCVQLTPEFKKLSKNTDIKLYAVHGSNPTSKNESVFSHFGVEGVPNIKYISKNGEISSQTYNGNRDVSSMLEYIKEMSSQKGGNNEEHKYKFGVKYSKSSEDFLQALRKEISKFFKSLDFQNDINAGIKLEKGQQIIVLKYLKRINKMKVDYPDNIKMLEEIEQGVMNEFPVEYAKLLKGKKLRRIVYKVSKKLSPKNKKVTKKATKKSIKEIMKMLISPKKRIKQVAGKKKVKKKIKFKYVKINDKYYKKYDNNRKVMITKKTYLKHKPEKKES